MMSAMAHLIFALTKPADAQTLVSVREFRFWQLVDVVVGVVDQRGLSTEKHIDALQLLGFQR
jgi:hypothetical protein